MAEEKLLLKSKCFKEVYSCFFHLLLAKTVIFSLPDKVVICSTVLETMKRDRVEIMAEILCLCLKPQTKTQVMYGTNLSWRMLQHYLSQLKKLDLLEINEKSAKYLTTQRGKEFVKKWKKLQEFL
jgi:predicted transcriptional regulator